MALLRAANEREVNMEYRQLANTDLKLSVITFGTIWFARPGEDPTEGKKAMNLALDMGVNCIHTSYEYKTRDVVHDVLKGRKDAKQLKHIIKVPDPDKKNTDNQYKPEYFRKLVEDALRELPADRIDLLQWILRDGTESNVEASLAKWDAYKDDVQATFEKLRDEGKVGYLGNFVYTNEYAEKVSASGRLTALLFYYNLWDTTIQGALDKLREHKMSAVVLRPLHGGMLTTKRANRNALPASDKWAKPDRLAMLAKRDQLFAEASLKDTGDLSTFAIKFALAQPNITSMITGMNTTEQVKQVLACADGKYPDPSLAQKLHQAMKKLGFKGEL
jgi:aryl-alcohol dehydrogenase-like predicted oxidoreductase